MIDVDASIVEYEATRYRCSHCRKSWASKSRCRQHLQRGCHKDPRTATCATCRYLITAHNFYDGDGCAMNCALFDDHKQDRPKGCPLWAPKGIGT
jgi:hypothetical protein